MPQLSTGLVIAGAYADKVRRVLFAQLRDKIKAGELTNQLVAQKAGELNRLLFDILVNKLKVDKGDVVRIRIEYDVVNGNIVWNLNTLRIEAFKRIPDNEVEKAVKETIEKAKEVLEKPVTREEASWTGAKPETYTIPAKVAEAIPLGKTSDNELLILLKDNRGENLGLTILTPENGQTRLQVLLIPGAEAYESTKLIDVPAEELSRDTRQLIQIVNELDYIKIPKEKAEEIIKSKMTKII